MVSKLAIHGGTPAIEPGAIRPWPWITEQDRAAVAAVLADGDIARQRQEQSEGLAREFAQYLGVRYCVPCNSGTAALHMCVAGLEIGPGDEVITTAHTYWATAAAVLHHNAIPVFVDIDPRTYCMDPARIEAAISDHTRAILPVHIHGMPCDMDPILSIAEKHGLHVIEDVAQAHGSQYRGRQCGTIGVCSGFSTQMSKNLTTGSEGGLFVTDDELVCERAKTLQYLGEVVIPGRERQDQQYNARGMGWMYRGDVFGQAFARSQLRRLDDMNAARIHNCHVLTNGLSRLRGIRTPFEPTDVRHTYYNYVLTLHPDELGLDVAVTEFRRKFERALDAEGMSAGQWQRMPVPAQSVFQSKVGFGKGYPWRIPEARDVAYRPEDYPVARGFIDAALYVYGIGPPNDEALMLRFVEAIAKVLDHPEQIMDVAA
jgi:dTDP-4-amino-4,6-dideoxygalactose transaminase